MNSTKSFSSWLVVGTVSIGTFMGNVDASIVNVALPTIGSIFHVGPPVFQWVVTAYLLAITMTLTLFGKISDRSGKKLIFQMGVVLFSLASLLCGLAPSLNILIAGRVLQGLGASMFVSTVMAIIVETVPANRRGAAIGFIGAVIAAGHITGPVLGGILIDTFGWRSIFDVNVPIGLFAAILGQFTLTQNVPAAKSPLDRSGTFYMMAWILAFSLTLSNLSSWGLTSEYTKTGITLFLFFLFLFLRRETLTDTPLVRLDFFHIAEFTLGNLTGFLSYVLLFFSAVMLPLYLHHVRGQTSLDIGLLLSPQAIGMILASPFAGKLADRIGPTWPTTIGMLTITLSDLLLTYLGRHTSLLVFSGSVFLTGLGNGLFMSPNNSSVMSSLPKEVAGSANGILATIRNLGMVVGTATAILVLHLTLQKHSHAPTSTVYLMGVQSVFRLAVVIALIATLLTAIRLVRDRFHGSLVPTRH